MNLAQFDLRKWETNNIKLKKQIQISESSGSSDTVPSTDDLQLTTRKVLDVNWDTKTDKFVFDFQEIATNALNLPPTKRNILKICNTFFDPLGRLSPIVLQVKLIFKELCINKYEWDTDFDHDIKMQWNEFLKPIVHWFLLESCAHMGRQLLCRCGEVSTCPDEEFFDRTFRTFFLFIVIKAYYNGC